MAMRENIRDIKATQDVALNLQMKKETERMRQKEKKEDLQQIEREIKEYLYNEFSKYIFSVGSTYNINFLSLERRQQLLDDFLNDKKIIKTIKTQEYVEKKVKNGIIQSKKYTKSYDVEHIQYRYEIIEFFNKHYNKILKEVTKQKQDDEQYQFYTACQNAELMPDKATNNVDVLQILKVIACIVFFPLFFIFAVLMGTCKKSK